MGGDDLVWRIEVEDRVVPEIHAVSVYSAPRPLF